jgi:hypothetical protein
MVKVSQSSNDLPCLLFVEACQVYGVTLWLTSHARTVHGVMGLYSFQASPIIQYSEGHNVSETESLMK